MPSRPILERIILNNFNSFKVDEVPLHKGFTVITGPNGAGKSTIFHGIKFSLGSNDKDGRAKVWSDFIRIGQNAGYAEIHLRNKKELIKIRRTILKGKAPYYKIQNGADSKSKKCTVSQVRTLLEGFGINPDNVFAFVSQGNITGIKNMEQKQICDYLERGLGLYPLRGEIIENKGTVSDLHAQITSLNLMDKSAKYELSILAPQLLRLNEKIKLEEDRDLLEKELTWLNRAKIQEEIKQITTEINALERNVSNLEDQKQEISVTINHLETSITETNQKISSLSQTLLDNKIQEKNLDLEIDKWQSDKDHLADKILRIKSTIKILNAEKNRFAQDLRICLAEIKKYKFEGSILHQRRKTLMDEFDSHQKTKKKYQKEMALYDKLKNQKNELELKSKENSLHSEAFDRDIQKCMNDIRYLRQELEKDKWYLKDPEKNSLEALTKNKRRVNAVLEKSSHDSAQLEKDTQELERKVEKLKNSMLMKQLPKSQNLINLMREIQSRNLDVIGPIIDHIEFKSEITLAVDSILSKYVLNSFIAKNKHDFMLVDDLIKRTGARCNIYRTYDKDIRNYKQIGKEDGVFGYLSDFITPLSNTEAVKKVLVSICRNTVLVKDRSIGYDFISRNDHRGRVVALDGTVLRSYEYVMESRASESRKAYSNPIEQKREVHRIQSQIMENRKKLDEYHQKRSKLERALDMLHERLQKIDRITFNYKNLNITINKKNSLLQKKKEFTEENSTLQSEINSIQNEINQVQKKFPENLDEMNQFNDKFRVNVAELDEKIENMNAVLTKKAKEENLINLKIEKYSSDVDAQSEDLEVMKTDLKSGDKKILQSINALGKLQDEIEAISKEQQELSESIQKVQEVIHTEQNSLNSIIQEMERIRIQIDYANAQIYDKQKMIENITVEVSELGEDYQERSIVEVENDLRVLYEKLREYYDVTDQIINRKIELEDQLFRTSQKRTELELEVVEAQKTVDSLQEQYFSLYSEHLLTIEAKINERFDKIGINRQGKLSLTGKFEDLGVEIFVQFQDTTRKLSTLSGGEQTLFAISLMLTLQNLNPSPFCIFDEAQMFLDKSNTENVSKLIKDVTESGVQFVMITPNASSSLVELADCVLGIAKNGSEEISTVIQL